MKTAANSNEPLAPHAPRRSAWNSFLRYWLPVLIWMAIIFGMSTGAGASRNTSRIIGPILRWFNPDIPDETISAIQLVIRKCAHFVEYGILALLLWRARRKPFRGDERPWKRSEALFAFTFAVAFALTDEWHQSFVPSREGALRDVFIDASGAAAALWAAWFAGRRLKKW